MVIKQRAIANEDKEARRHALLDAAETLFLQHPDRVASVAEVAEAAGLAKGTVYLYFPSKVAVLKALIEAKVGPLAQNVQQIAAMGAADPKTALRMMVTAAAFRLNDPNLFAVPRLVIGISGRFPEIAKYYREHVVEKARGALETLIEGAMAKGQIRRVDKDAVVRAFIGPLFFEAMWTHVLGGETALNDPQKLIEQQFDVLLSGLEPRA
jgi:AcrR family transcriptional regulator